MLSDRSSESDLQDDSDFKNLDTRCILTIASNLKLSDQIKFARTGRRINSILYSSPLGILFFLKHTKRYIIGGIVISINPLPHDDPRGKYVLSIAIGDINQHLYLNLDQFNKLTKVAEQKDARSLIRLLVLIGGESACECAKLLIGGSSLQGQMGEEEELIKSTLDRAARARASMDQEVGIPYREAFHYGR